MALLIWNNVFSSYYPRPYVLAVVKLDSSGILNSRQQTARRYSGMVADGQMVEAKALREREDSTG